MKTPAVYSEHSGVLRYQVVRVWLDTVFIPGSFGELSWWRVLSCGWRAKQKGKMSVRYVGRRKGWRWILCLMEVKTGKNWEKLGKLCGRWIRLVLRASDSIRFSRYHLAKTRETFLYLDCFYFLSKVWGRVGVLVTIHLLVIEKSTRKSQLGFLITFPVL